MAQKSMSVDRASKKPRVLVFAGPNGSGKTTVAQALPVVGVYINADDLKKEYGLTDLEAAQKAESLRNSLVDKNEDFTFETVLSTERNLLLLQNAKQRGYEVRSIYVLTCNEAINVARVKARYLAGGHDVPEDKIRTRYQRALGLLPRLLDLCDDILVYDNTEMPLPIFSKQGLEKQIIPNRYWSKTAIEKLTSSF